MAHEMHHPDGYRGPAEKTHNFRYYDLAVHAFVVVLLVSNLVAQKICAIGPFTIGGVTVGPFLLSGAQILFPITYIFGDIFVEVYGYGASRRAIWIGFFSAALLAVMALITTSLPAAPEWKNQDAFEKVFGFVPRVLIASLVAYWCGEFANAFVMSKMKLLTKGKHLWTRTIGSTVVGQFVDTVVVIFVIFVGVYDLGTMLNLIFTGYFAKVIYEATATPLTYLVVNTLKRAEGVDAFDEGVNFNPFQAR
ncbi:MAG: queuosine precursor transporter [Bryobacterales bacterium]|nr:queuosine precursor transporter [Bryobacterales bacterium]